MANIEEVSGVFGGVKVNDENTNNVVENSENIENAGEYMYTTMEYYSDVFPYIYVNMIKVGELSGSVFAKYIFIFSFVDNVIFFSLLS